jgi:hypothetical protein
MATWETYLSPRATCVGIPTRSIWVHERGECNGDYKVERIMGSCETLESGAGASLTRA